MRRHPHYDNIQPLPFNRVYGTRSLTSNFPVLQLPIELFSCITRYIAAEDLASLALVDQDCRILAALDQFKSLRLNISSSKSSFFQACDTTIQHDTQLIRSCVRKLHVVMHLEDGHPQNTYPNWMVNGGMSGVQLDDSFQALGDMFEFSLPNLQIIDFDLPLPLPPQLLDSIFKSPIQHLRLNEVMFTDALRAPLVAGRMPLETLCLKISWQCMQDRGNILDHILRHAAPTLQRLVLQGQGLCAAVHIPDDMPAFPHLRSLVLDRVAENQDRLFNILLGPFTHIHTLTLDSSTESNRLFLQNRGRVPSLDHFCWLNNATTMDGASDVLSFLSHNTFLETVQVRDALPVQFINDELLPLLQGSFSSLTSLKLVWAGSNISEDSLKAIASIQTLRGLWLSTGNQNTLRNTWDMDINAILTLLSPLENLEALAFSKDTYQTDIHPLAPVFCDYYGTKALPIDADLSRYLSAEEYQAYKDAEHVSYDEAVPRQVKIRRVAWERWHAEQMLLLANRCAEALVGLMWCFIGQLEFSIGLQAGKRHRVASMDSVIRNPCLWPLKKRMALDI